VPRVLFWRLLGACGRVRARARARGSCWSRAQGTCSNGTRLHRSKGTQRYQTELNGTERYQSVVVQSKRFGVHGSLEYPTESMRRDQFHYSQAPNRVGRLARCNGDHGRSVNIPARVQRLPLQDRWRIPIALKHGGRHLHPTIGTRSFA
jgi:hypothetical protein